MDSTSIEIGYDPALTVQEVSSPSAVLSLNCAVPLMNCTPRYLRTQRWKFWASPGRWKPIRSAPVSPSSTALRHGSCEKISVGGKGMWLKKPMVTSGRSLRSMRGTSCSW